jgi:peroxiredoxin
MKMLIFLLLFAGTLTAADFTIGQEAPDFELGTQKWNTPEGFKKLSSFRGKVVLVELWASY